MGIFIYLNISDTIQAEEWKRAYEKSLVLVEQMPLIDITEKEYYGANLLCAIKTAETKKGRELGWNTIGDSSSMKCAEDYFLPRDILARDKASVSEEEYVDPYMSILSAYSNFSYEDKRCNRVRELWGNKTQAEPYHFYLLAVACMLEHELPGKVAVYGDITRGQYRRAARIASTILGEEIPLPDRCDLQKLYHRVKKMPLQEKKMVAAFSILYLGNQDKDFGEFIQKNFSMKELQAFWANNFEYSEIATYGFSNWLKKYLLWGFPIADLKKYIQFHDKEDGSLAEKFVKAVLDTEIFLEEKDCEDVLEIDKEEEGSYSIHVLMAQFVFAEAKNQRVNQYIPLKELVAELVECVGDCCDVSRIVTEYMEQHEKDIIKDNPSDLLNAYVHGIGDKLMSSREKYDIATADDLILFKNKSTISESLNKWSLSSFAVYRSALEEEYYQKLLQKDFTEAVRFLIEHNRSLLLIKESWEKIFNDLEKNLATLERYYPMVRMKLSTNDQAQWIRALVLNDEFYQYCMDHQLPCQGNS